MRPEHRPRLLKVLAAPATEDDRILRQDRVRLPIQDDSTLQFAVSDECIIGKRASGRSEPLQCEKPPNNSNKNGFETGQQRSIHPAKGSMDQGDPAEAHSLIDLQQSGHQQWGDIGRLQTDCVNSPVLYLGVSPMSLSGKRSIEWVSSFSSRLHLSLLMLRRIGN